MTFQYPRYIERKVLYRNGERYQVQLGPEWRKIKQEYLSLF